MLIKNKRQGARYLVLLVSLSALGACGTLEKIVPVRSAKPAGTAAKPSSPLAVQQLNRINQLQAEVRELRNQLEEQQFEFDNLRQRQQDLFTGLDQRLRIAENMQQTGNPGNASFNNASVDFQSQSSVLPSLQGQHQTIPGTEPSSDLPVTQTQDSETASIDQQAIYDQGFEHLKQSRYTDAIAQFTQLVSQFPNGGLADDASYWIGEANYVNRQYEAAIRAFRKVVLQYPSSDRVPEALLKVGYVQYDIGDYKSAKSTFEDVQRRYANHPVAISAKSRIQRIDQGISN